MSKVAAKCIKHVSIASTEDENPLKKTRQNVKPRDKWGSKADFILSMIGYSVGFGNIWRFPYLAGKHGGAAFLIPYFIMLFATGWPMFYMELNMGQYSGGAPHDIYSKMSPLFSGLGWSNVVIQIYTSVYYNLLLAWAIRYLFASFTTKLPWTTCDNEWNTQNCLDDRKMAECTNGTFYANGTCHDENALLAWDPNFQQKLQNFHNTTNAKSAPEEYLYNRVYHLSSGIDEIGTPQAELVGCLALAWLLVFGCIYRGIKSSGKVVYFTATFPYIILFILLIRGVTLEGAYEGIKFYLVPKIDRLANGQAWADAAQQVFFSMSIGGGGLTTLASYNNFHDNTMRDTAIVALTDSFTSIFAGFTVFSILGFISHTLGKTVEEVAKSGSGLAFITYPEAVSRMPLAPLWSVLFFFMLIIVGIDSQIVYTEVVISSIVDKFPRLRRFRYKILVTLAVCIAFFLLGLILTTPGGPYIFNLIDNYACGYSLIIACLIEICMVSYVYGLRRFIGDVSLMLGEPPSYYWKLLGYPVGNYFKINWALITPLTMAASFIFMIKSDFSSPPEYNGYFYPVWANVLAWLITLSCVILVPIFAVYMVWKQISDKKPLKELLMPTADWGPQGSIVDLRSETGVELIMVAENGTIDAKNGEKRSLITNVINLNDQQNDQELE